MTDFEYYLPIKLVFGRGKASLAGKVTKPFGKKALVVTGRSSAKKTGLLDRITESLALEGIDSAVFDRVEQNPLTTTVAEGVRFLADNRCDVVLGLGGGSAMDAAKGIAFSALNPGGISDYIFGKPGNGALPIVLITTTAGTGSEGDSLAVLTDPATKNKKSLRSPCIYPKASIVDPELMSTLPPPIIAATGIDALCHLIEAYMARRSNPVTAMMAVRGMQLISSSLPEVYDNPRNIDAWDNVALASTFGGMVIDGSGVTLPHALEHPVSGLLDAVHGLGLAALMPAILQASCQAAPKKFADIAEALGENIQGLTAAEAAAKSAEGFRRLAKRVGLSPTLGSLGVREEHIGWLAENSRVIMPGAIENNPWVPGLEDTKGIYRASL